jgi:hypothetical protein
MSMKQKAVIFFLFFSIFCSESEDESFSSKPKEVIDWSPLISVMAVTGNITREQERIFSVVKAAVRCFLGSLYDERFQQEKVFSVEPVLKINAKGELQSTSFIAIAEAILFCSPNQNTKRNSLPEYIRHPLLDLWKYQTVKALDAITSGHLIPRETIPESFLKEADRIFSHRTYPIIVRNKTEEVLDQVAILSRMASTYSTPVSSPTKGLQNHFVMPGFYGHQRSSSHDFDNFNEMRY